MSQEIITLKHAREVEIWRITTPIGKGVLHSN